ncbi:MAG TPA: cupin domain-containing protein [Vicinamibacterales bacterium]|nr:cupin domain-containing protein [Vicinamibacterales bacterium]
MHYFGRFDDSALRPHPTYNGHSDGYRLASLVDHVTGSVHTGLSMNELAPGGSIDPHVHSFEEGFYLLSGQAVVTINTSSYLLGPGDYAAVKVGTPHAWHAAGSSPVRWLSMAAPQPKPHGALRDTFFAKDRTVPSQAPRLDVENLDGNLLGHFDVSQIPPPSERGGGLQGLEGVFLKWMIDENFGARHHRLLFIEYQPGVSIAPHDHTFEEAYFILSGEVEGTLDGRTYRATAGDVLWTSVGCVHTFVNKSTEPVRWLETFSPQPPKENVFRFVAEWETKARELEGES